MVTSPMTVLCISWTALAFGVVLAFWGKRGKPIDEHPVCRKCRFDLVGRPPGSDRCPECGADLGRKRSITTGNRKPQRSAIIIGGCSSILAFCVFSGWGWVRFHYLNESDKPTWLVLLDAKSSKADFRSTALWELSDRQSGGRLSESQCNAYIDRLIPLTRSAEVDVREDAMQKLSDLGAGNQRAIQALVALLSIPDLPRKDPSDLLSSPTTVGDFAAFCLNRMSSPVGDQAMLKEVRGGSPLVLKHWLSNNFDFDDLGDLKMAQLLVDALGSDDQELSKRAADAISNWKHFPTGPVFAGLKSPNRKIRITCTALLPVLDKPPTDDQIQPLLRDPNPDIRISAEVVLAEMHDWPSDPKVESFLIGVLGDTHGVCRGWAADALSNYKDQASIRALALAMREVRSEIALDALLSLESIGNEAALDAIMDIIDDLPPSSGDRRYTESVADRMVHGSYKNTPYWKKHEAAKARALNAQP